jgi:hypothetical protein
MAQDYTTMRVPTEEWEAAKASKRETETWGEFIQRCTEEPPEIVELTEAPETVRLEAEERRKIAEEIAEVLR